MSKEEIKMRGEEMTKVSLAAKLILGDGGDVTRRCSTVSGNFSEWRCRQELNPASGSLGD